MVSRYYIDTMVLVYYLKSKYYPTLSSTAKLFMSKIESGKYEGVVSTLTLVEVIRVLRRLMVEKEHIITPNDRKIETEKALRAIWEIRNISIEKKYEVDENKFLTLRELADDGLVIMQKYVGKVEYNGTKPRHDGISPMDAYHIVIAKRMGCSNIATFDNDFDETSAEIKPLKLQKDPF